MVLKDPYGSLNPRKTIGETLSLVFNIHFDLNQNDIKKKVLDLLKMVELNHF